MLAQRLRRWLNNKKSLFKRVVFAGRVVYSYRFITREDAYIVASELKDPIWHSS